MARAVFCAIAALIPGLFVAAGPLANTPSSAPRQVAHQAGQAKSQAGRQLPTPAREDRSRLVIQKRYRHDSAGEVVGHYWTLGMSPRRTASFGGNPDPVQDGCPDTASVRVLAHQLDRGELLLADLDCDGVYTGSDLAVLATALGGPDAPTGGPALCKPTDHDADGDTDLADLAILQQVGGPSAPMRVDYRVDEGPWTPLFGEQDVSPDDIDTFGWAGAGSSLALRGRAAFPQFQGGWFSAATASDDPQRAIVLTHGSNVQTELAARGAQPAFAGQQALQQILGDMINWDTGEVMLPENEMLVLYELGTNNLGSPAFDFNDLVLHVTTECPNGQEVVFRDSIGGDNSTTNDNFPFSATWSGSDWRHVPVKLNATENTTLTFFRGIAGQTTDNLTWSHFDYKVRVWSSQSALDSSPHLGDIANVTLSDPTTGPTSYGNMAEQMLIGIRPSWEITFDLTSLGLIVPAGQQYFITVEFISTTGVAQSGNLGWVESTEFYPTDWRYRSIGDPQAIDTLPTSLHSGRLGFEVRGTSR